MFLPCHYTYIRFTEWELVLRISPETVKTLIPEFDGKNFLNKGAIVVKDKSVAYTDWLDKASQKQKSVFGFLDGVSPVKGIVAVYNYDGQFMLVKYIGSP